MKHIMQTLVIFLLAAAFMGVLTGDRGGSLPIPVVSGVAGAVEQLPIGGGVTKGDPFGGRCRPVVTQVYGRTDYRAEPIINGVHFHTGIDLACPANTPIYAISGGHARALSDSGFGNSVVVQNGRYFVRYAHLNSFVADLHLATFQSPFTRDVQAGDELGLEGSTGNSSGPHLHLEIDVGSLDIHNSIDPRPYVPF